MFKELEEIKNNFWRDAEKRHAELHEAIQELEESMAKSDDQVITGNEKLFEKMDEELDRLLNDY